ncbi:hypothetical protein GUITHDRAFT_117023 [Guillardia theta CCMP2712]|uniref:Uncharacterized protein n=1 Tax=Guillardia theta (strain CCMP2712) TaxID=905079 RepID=L1ILU5_GUITC|nr:hypothetical protein GUITHDRAFT_117023 [Guillardia theta CCMP2712]EKX36854.1 hypothetical protein GUITHDRAFT_117023 [Guillardia theta CCMP2712]|eukprot:XP_005823834.1 hypothetical protein GUITHDRAFT_117023 [Guillardia theta CCMP2712]
MASACNEAAAAETQLKQWISNGIITFDLIQKLIASSAPPLSVPPGSACSTSSSQGDPRLAVEATPASSPPASALVRKRRTPDSSDSDQSDEYFMDTESEEELDVSSLPPELGDQTRLNQRDMARRLSIDMSEDEIVKRVLGIVFPDGDPATVRKMASYRFDVAAAVRMAVRKLKSARERGGWKRFDVSEGGDLPEIIAGGVTQNGKTKIKVLGIITAGLLGIGTILLSTTHRGVQTLTDKINAELGRLVDKKLGIECICLTAVQRPTAYPGILLKYLQTGCCTLPDSAYRIRQMCSILQQTNPAEYPCQLIMDEADSFYRNRRALVGADDEESLCRRQSRITQLEEALDQLRGVAHLVLRWNVSATLVPVFLHLQDKRGGVDTQSILYTKPEGDYIGVVDFKPLVVDGEEQFIEYGDLKPSNLYCNDLTDEMFRQAFSKDKSLTLVMNNSRVNAINNVFDLATSLQRDYPHVAALVIVGGPRGISYFPPPAPKAPLNGPAPSKDELNTKPQISVSQAIEMVDRHAGLDTPLVIVGYSQMIRGDSFRSSLRVPTHLICALGTAMSIEKMVQAMGRATYQNSTLESNGFSHVTVLTYAMDYDTAQAYPQWLLEMETKLAEGMMLPEALSSSAQYTDKANFTFRQRKPIGQKKDMLSLDVSYSRPQPGQERAGRRWLDRRMRSNPVASKLIELAKRHAESFESYMQELTEDDFAVGLTAREYCDEWNKSVSEGEAASLNFVTSNLTKLVDNGIMKRSHDKPARYWLPCEEI